MFPKYFIIGVFEMRGITIWRIVDGKEWSSFDQLVAYSQVVHHVQGKLWPLRLRWPVACRRTLLAKRLGSKTRGTRSSQAAPNA
jgi:hypothetical protein